MKLLLPIAPLLSVLLLPALHAPGQQLQASLPAHAARPAGFVPPGWTLEQQTGADLNRDGRPDALLLLRAPGGAAGTPSRTLAVALRGKDGYTLADANSRLLPASGPDQEDPLANGGITASAGGFTLKLTLLSGAGSYESAVLTYRFRYQPGCVRLIGYDRLGTNRNTLDNSDLSVNFLTGATIRQTGNAQSAAAPNQTRGHLTANPRLCLGQLDNPAAFNPQ